MKYLLAAFLLLHSGSAAYGERVVSEEARIFSEVRDGVFTVFGDRGQGSGFLVDDGGLILTNSHVVSGSRHISVQISESIRLPAELLAEDKQKDIAVLRVALAAVEDMPRLLLAPRRGPELAFVGERVLAIGSPLNQQRILTTGIVSKVEASAIISDVNINHGNSGGPLINMDAEVVAINTFGDFSQQGGPGVSGSISIDLARPVLAQAREAASRSNAPPNNPLPVAPDEAYPLSQLGWVAKRSFDNTNYYISAPGFDIAVLTAPRSFFLSNLDISDLAKKRQQRQRAAGVEEQELYDPVGDTHKEWMEYLGMYAPVVEFIVVPKMGQTSGSAFGNFLGAVAAGAAGTAYYGSYNYEFKGDLEEFWIEHDGEYIPELMRGLGVMPVSASAANAWGAHHMEDIAQQGRFMFLPGAFLGAYRDAIRDPEGRASEGVTSDGEWDPDEGWSRTRRSIPAESPGSAIRIHLKDLKKPGEEVIVPIPRAVLEQIWADFEGIRDSGVLHSLTRAGELLPNAPEVGE